MDGDTLTTDAGTIRLIGIDTPERGECGHAEAEIYDWFANRTGNNGDGNQDGIACE